MRGFRFLVLLLGTLCCTGRPVATTAEAKLEDANCDSLYAAAVDRMKHATVSTEEDPNTGNRLTGSTELELLRSAIDACPDDARFQALMAQTLITLGDNSGAIEHARVAVSTDPQLPSANYMLGVALTLVGDHDEGLEYLKESVRLDPEEPGWALGYCSSLENAGRYKEAIQACTRLVADEEVGSAALYIRGRAHEALGHADDAKRDYEQSERLGGNFSQYYSPDHYRRDRPIDSSKP